MNTFKYKYAYISENNNSTCLYIDDYIKKYSNNSCSSSHKILCNNRHPMKIITVNNNNYFIHNSNIDMCKYHITNWHCKWQSNFDCVEYLVEKILNQIKDRYADIFLKSYNLVIELQHTLISLEEVTNRNHDYNIHNIKVLWIIDGNDKNIIINKLEWCNRIYIEFTKENKWIYKNFLCNDIIYIDINNYIYAIPPNDIKSDMIDIDQPYDKDIFIDMLKCNNKNIYLTSNIEQCTLYLKQQGAGNGKTYGIIQTLTSQEFEHYKYIIIVTKQHSAKYVIYNEFSNQIKNNNILNIDIIRIVDSNKKYIIEYKNSITNCLYKIIIGTIDSLMYSLGDKNHKELDKFQGFVNSIIDGYINTTSIINYNNISVKLNKEVCLIVDETQDLSIEYGKAIIQIMRNKYIDSYVVGDKLQSIMYENNAFTYLLNNDFSYINKIVYTPTNICRRFYYTTLVNFINSIIPFNNYNLPIISSYNLFDKTNILTIFSGSCSELLNEENVDIKLNNDIEQILSYYKYEVETNNYEPNDFLIITPFTKYNPLVTTLETTINLFWNEKNMNTEFKRYAIFHKSEIGSSIDLSESENTTRIVSIHTAKGDGRNVVFVLGLSEYSLVKFSGKKNNLIYESLLHVALTRMKEKLYIRIIENNDDIHLRLSTCIYNNNINTNINICLTSYSSSIKFNTFVNYYLKKQNYFTDIQNNIINKYDKLKSIIDADNNKCLIDMGHHNIRFMSMIIAFIVETIKHYRNHGNNDLNMKKQILAILINVNTAIIEQSDDWKKYNTILVKNYQTNKSNIENNKKDKFVIPLLKLSNHGKEYIAYYNIINSFIINVKKKINSLIDNKKNIQKLCPMQSIILYYMIEVTTRGIHTDFSIMDLYNIIDIYKKSFTVNIKGHDKCPCKSCFLNKSSNIEVHKNNMKTYLLDHYEKIKNLKTIYSSFFKSNDKINILMNHKLYYNNKYSDDIIISKTFKFIGFDDNNTYIIYIKPHISEINYNEIIIDSIYDVHLLSTISNSDITSINNKLKNDYNRFNNKTINIIFFTLDKDIYYKFDFIVNNTNLILSNNNLLLNNIKTNIVEDILLKCSNLYNFYNYYLLKTIEKAVDLSTFIKLILSHIYSNKHIKQPNFVISFLDRIDCKLDLVNTSTDKKNILLQYNDKTFFVTELKNKILQVVNIFFNNSNEDMLNILL